MKDIKNLRRSTTNRIFFGIAGGITEFFKIDVISEGYCLHCC